MKSVFKTRIPLLLKKDGSLYPIGKKAPMLSGGKFVAGKSYKQENHIRNFIAKWYQGDLLDQAIEVRAYLYLEKPKSIPKKRSYPMTKPDLDNFFKTLGDAGEGFIWRNDSRICNLILAKRYLDEHDKKPFIDLEVIIL